ncbi:MAG TPA: hypothetical protein VF658_13635 [Pyrinomonadaceae bacterium]|jgi:hypothetical protein
MSELSEAEWAVISERGVEASDLPHRQALELMQHLTEEKVNGLCIVTAAAARRFTHSTPAQFRSNTAQLKP